MVNVVYKTVRDCCKCSRNKPGDKSRRSLQLVQASSPLDFVRIDILWPLQKMLNGNQFVLVMIVCYLKLIRAVSMAKNASLQMAYPLHKWIILCALPTHELTDSGLHLVSYLPKILCTFLEPSIWWLRGTTSKGLNSRNNLVRQYWPDYDPMCQDINKTAIFMWNWWRMEIARNGNPLRFSQLWA